MTEPPELFSDAISAAIAWIERDFLVEDKREEFRVELERVIRRDLKRAGRCLLYVDYDPQDSLLEAVRAAGIECSGFGGSARGIFRYQKAGVDVRPDRVTVKTGYGSGWRELWPNPDQHLESARESAMPIRPPEVELVVRLAEAQDRNKPEVIAGEITEALQRAIPKSVPSDFVEVHHERDIVADRWRWLVTLRQHTVPIWSELDEPDVIRTKLVPGTQRAFDVRDISRWRTQDGKQALMQLVATIGRELEAHVQAGVHSGVNT